MAASSGGSRESSTAEEVEDQDHERYDEEQVDQTTADVEAEAQKPEHAQHHQNRPKHILAFLE
jgi:hypothetical protein